MTKSIKTLRDISLFAVFGALIFLSKMLTEALPNIHMIAMFITVFTVVYRAKALIPIYIFVFLTGIYGGFSLWWIPYLYIWTVMWLFVMLIPKNLPKKVAPFVYCGVAGLHGILYGTLYAPAQAIMFHLNFKQTVSWIIAGLPWDLVQCAGNIVITVLAVPLIKVLQRLEKTSTL